MSLSSGTKLGPYEIVAPLGAGGMGEVYRARDTRLDRDVAIKVLPAHLSANLELKQRFEREARAISSLNHPHICTLHDVGHQEGTDFLVMEHLEGETLAKRLERGPLPLEELLARAMEIADALDKAHRKGLVHRDLKPGNIMLTPHSGAKVLDFGLAKATRGLTGSSSLTAAPTMSSPAAGTAQGDPLTAEGRVVGTFQYMSPEQLEGKEADARSDIFALGAVLYEMATAKRAFAGKTQYSVASAILEKDPEPIRASQPQAPPALERVISRCLAKDPEDRWQTARDAVIELQWIAGGNLEATAPAVAVIRASREKAAWAVAGVGLLLAVALGIGFVLRAPQPARTTRASLLPPQEVVFARNAYGLALSPDGTRLLFNGVGVKQGGTSLWLRSLDSLTAQEIAGTRQAIYPFWSPDGQFIAFFAGGKLKKVNAAGGPVVSLANAEDPRGGAWSKTGIIVFAPKSNGELMQVSDAGGPVTPVTSRKENEDSHRWPEFLPDGKTVVFFVAQKGLGGPPSIAPGDQTSGLYAVAVGEKEHRFLRSTDSGGRYAQPGFLLFVREGNLIAQPFDAGGVKVSGSPTPVVEQVDYHVARWNATYSVSTSGLLVYMPGEQTANSELALVDRAGRKIQTLGPPGSVWAPDITPDGARVAFEKDEPGSGNTDIWIHEMERGIQTRLTVDPTQERRPTWSPDGKQLAYSVSRQGGLNLAVRPATGLGAEEILEDNKEPQYLNDWSPDGSAMVYMNFAGGQGPRLWIFDLREKKRRPLLGTKFPEAEAQFSPDGKWLAYASEETGRSEIYVVPYPDLSRKIQISDSGGSQPRWRRDGRELFYIAPDAKLMSAAVRSGAAFSVDVPKALFETRIRVVSRGYTQYDVMPDGQRFVFNWRMSDEQSRPLVLVTNWTAELKK